MYMYLFIFIHFYFLFLETCSNGEVKLSGSTNPLTGRVEFCSKYIWTSICSIHWSYDDAQVACRNLGHSPFGKKYKHKTTYKITKF